MQNYDAEFLPEGVPSLPIDDLIQLMRTKNLAQVREGFQRIKAKDHVFYLALCRFYQSL